MTARRWFSLSTTLVGLLVFAPAVQADTIQIDPGGYGSYYANGSLAQAGSYSLRPAGGGFLWQDRTGIQTQDLGAMADGAYEIVARDAGVVIGTFTNSSGTLVSPSGSITVTGGTNVAFVTKDVVVTGAAGWASCVRVWCMSWSQNGLTKFVLPVNDGWNGFWGNANCNNTLRMSVAANGDVAVVSQSPNIGITGGNGVLKFPNELADITVTITAQPGDMSFWSIDWATGNLNFSTQTLKLYGGTYGIANNGSGTWLGGNTLTIPVDTVNWQTTKVYSNAVSTYTWTFSGPRYTPPNGSVIWQE